MSDPFAPPPVHAVSLLDDPPRMPPRGPSGVSAPMSVDPIRACALESAAHWHIGSSMDDDRYDATRVVKAARTFEAYLRGEQLSAGPTRPHIVTLCGSTRHKAEFERMNRVFTFAGAIVLSVGVFGHADRITLTDDAKAALDELHLRKIDLADEVVVINPDGRIGDSTRSEIAYATAAGKAVTYLVEPDGDQ